MIFIEKYLFYSVILLPFALVSGPFLSDVLVSTSGIFFLIYLKWKNQIFSFLILNKYFILFLTWCFYLVVRSLFSDFPELSLESSLFYFRFGIFAMLVLFLCENNDKFIKYFSISLIIVFLILIFDGFFQFLFGFNLIGIESSADRVSGFFGDEKVLGSFISRLFPLLFAIILFSFQHIKNLNVYLFILLVIADVLIFISGDRTAFFYVILFTFITVIFSSNFKMLRIITFLISGIIIYVLLSFSPQIKERTLSKTINEFQIKQNNNELSSDKNDIEEYIKNKFSFNFFTLSHTKMYLAGINIFFDNYLFGTGTKTYRVICNDEKYIFYEACQSHPHNTYVQLLSETGLIGTLPIIILLGFVLYFYFKILYFKFFYKKIIYSDNLIYLMSALTITLWPFAPTGNFFNNWLSIIYFLPLGFVLYFFIKKEDMNV